jgi:general secretion pathway protein F
MPVFEYKALDPITKKETKSIVDADSLKAARARLRKQGLYPTEIREQQEGATRRGKSILETEIDFAKYFQFITTRDVSVMTTQLSTLVGAHVPMGEALAALVEQTEKEKLKSILSKIKERVNEGSGLADAMSDHPKVFDDLYVQMIRAGERSGALAEVLKRLAAYSDAQVKLQGQIMGAVTYPILLGIFGVGILVALFLGVVPRLRTMFDAMPGGQEALPVLTRIVFLIGDMLVYGWWLLPIMPFAMFFGWRWYVSRPVGRLRWDRLRLKLPVFGTMSRLVAVSRFCRTLSTLLVSGVPILSALQIVEAVIGNVVIAETVAKAANNIREGQSIAQPLKASGEFPPLVTHMISIGEKTGELERMLRIVADNYEDQVEATIRAMTSLLAPLMIMGIGGVVFLVALGLLTPMMNISSMVK